VPDPTLYLFDGYNVLHVAGIEDRRELVDMLASFVALRGARGVVVFDGVGADETYGALDVRYAANADAVLERLAAEHRAHERVCLVSSDAAVRGTSGQEVAKISSREFAATLAAIDVDAPKERPSRSRVGDRVDEETRARLEEMRRGPVE
jgi:predicted RNA-binding protein with PIN domain